MVFVYSLRWLQWFFGFNNIAIIILFLLYWIPNVIGLQCPIIVATTVQDGTIDSRKGMDRRCALHYCCWTPTSFVIVSGFGGIPTLPAFALDTADIIASRFDSSVLVKPPSSNTDSLTCYPEFLEGKWDVTQTLTGVQAPLGYAFAGGPGGSEAIGRKGIEDSESRLGQPVHLQLSYIRTGKGCVTEDRLFNTRQRLNSFAGRNVVASVDYTKGTPTTTTLVRFKGPAVQKSFVTSRGGGYITSSKDDRSNGRQDSKVSVNNQSDNAGVIPKNINSQKLVNYRTWVGFETQRSLFALTNESTAPPISTDTELLFMFTRIDANDEVHNSNNAGSNDVIEARLRIVGYLNPNDKLYFEARNRAVTIQDYTLLYKRKIEDQTQI